jgi:hypothetical protein
MEVVKRKRGRPLKLKPHVNVINLVDQNKSGEAENENNFFKKEWLTPSTDEVQKEFDDLKASYIREKLCAEINRRRQNKKKLKGFLISSLTFIFGIGIWYIIFDYFGQITGSFEYFMNYGLPPILGFMIGYSCSSLDFLRGEGNI